jgi:hypothetical protein
MKYRVTVSLTAERGEMTPRTLWEGPDWADAKEKLNFWANEHRDDMDRICLRVIGKE